MIAASVVLPSHSPPLSDAEYDQAVVYCDRIAELIARREAYIEANHLDWAVNCPAANWVMTGDAFQGYDTISKKLREQLNFLRLYTQVFTGNFMGVQCVAGTLPLAAPPRDADEQILGYLQEIRKPTMAWWIRHYDLLTRAFPKLAELSLPTAFGESGFRVGNVIVNHDLVVYLERIALLTASDALTGIDDGRRAIILEIGSGFGGLAYLLKQIIQNSTYICVDLPESLCFAVLYMSYLFPNVHLASEETDWSNLTQFDFVFVPNYMFHHIVESGLRVDLAINTLSMSEMTVEQVRSYCVGLAHAIGDSGVFFEQNQDNRQFDLCFAREIVAEFFDSGQPVTLGSIGVTQGTAALWRSPRANT